MVKLRALMIWWLVVIASNETFPQYLSPTVISTAGGSYTADGYQLDQTLGEPVNAVHDAVGVRLNQGFQQAEPVRLRLNMRAFLQGPWDSGSGWMSDALRSAGYLPMTEPYSALGFQQQGSGGERTSATVLATSGPDAVVDWVFLELRAPLNNTLVIATRNALVQRDGDIVDIDGESAVAFAAPAGPYFLCVKHRNHLAVLTAMTVPLSPVAVPVDLTDGSTSTFGTGAQRTVGAVRLSWSGDVTGDGLLKYTGSGNDRDPVLVNVGGTTPNNTMNGYHRSDVNLDGIVKYTGSGNDRDPILINVGGTTPNSVRAAQLP